MSASAEEASKPARPSLFGPAGAVEPRISVLAALDPGMPKPSVARASRSKSPARGIVLAVAGAGAVSMALAWALWREAAAPVVSTVTTPTRPIQPPVAPMPAGGVEATPSQAGARIEIVEDSPVSAISSAEPISAEAPGEHGAAPAAPAALSSSPAATGEAPRVRSPIMRALTSSEASAPAARATTPARSSGRNVAVDSDVLLLEALVSYSRRQQAQAEHAPAGKAGAAKAASEVEGTQP